MNKYLFCIVEVFVLKKIFSDKIYWSISDQSRLEGNIPLPEGVDHISAILNSCGKVRIDSVKKNKEGIVVSGTAQFTVLYVLENEDISSFDVETDFEHVSQGIVFDDNTIIEANAELHSINCKSEGAFIKLNADVYIYFFKLESNSVEVIDINKEENDLQICYVENKLYNSHIKKVRCYLNHEYKIQQNIPDISKIIYSDGYAILNNIMVDDNKTVLEGELKFKCLYKNADNDSQNIYIINDAVPFGEILSDDFIGDNTFVNAVPSIERININYDIDSKSIEVSALISLCVVFTNEYKDLLVTDMFSVKNESKVIINNIYSSKILPYESFKKVFRNEMDVPETYPEVEKILFCSTDIEILNTHVKNDRLFIEGMLYRNICYRSKNKTIKNIKSKEALEENFPFIGNDKYDIKAYSEYTNVSVSGKNLILKTSLEYLISRKEEKIIKIVTGFEKGNDIDNFNGMHVHFADGYETLFDIAKKYHVKADQVICLDDNCDPPKSRERVLII